jgi:integrase
MVFPTDASFARKSWTNFGLRLVRDLTPARHPLGVKRLLDRWLAADGITDGALFRTLRKGARSAGKRKPLSDDLVYTLVRRTGSAIGHPQLTSHDLRSYAALRNMPNGHTAAAN